MYLTVCERQRRDPRPALSEPEDFYYAAVLEKNRGNVAEAIAHLNQARARTAAAGSTSCWRAATRSRASSRRRSTHLQKAIEEDQRHRVLARHDRDFDPVRETPEFQKLLAS